ncbi:MAG: hypothetical protein Q9176_003126 [Flavoplaca citrina]
MDDELDDLFGDQQLGEDITHLPHLPTLPRGLVLRINELRASGCSQKIAWSNTGCIASIADDGCTAILRNLYCDPTSGLWKLSNGDEAKAVVQAHDRHTLKHLSWNHTGTELAVIDNLGNISVSSLLSSINRSSLSSRCVLGAEDDLSAPVGSMWLNQDRPLLLHGLATKNTNGQWTFTGSRFRQAGPHNPHVVGEQSSRNKAAFVAITRVGSVRLLYQGPDGVRWLEIKADLENISSAQDLLTHAAICAEMESSMLVATYSVSKRIRTYRVGVDWSSQSVVITHLRNIADCSPINDTLVLSGLPLTSPHPEPQLYHLELLSPAPAPDLRRKELLPPMLLAFFCSSASTDKQPTVAVDQSTFITRWESSITKPSLHPSFAQSGLKKPNGTGLSDLQPEITFKRLQDVRVNKVLVAVRELHLATTLVLCYSDGSVEFRSRSTLEPLLRDVADRVSSLAQVGLEYLPDDPLLHSALSPSACALVSLDEEGTAKIRLMQIPQPYCDNILNKAGIEAVAEACLMQFNMSYVGYGNYHDDLSAVMQKFQKHFLKDRPEEAREFVHVFLSDMCRILQLNVDYSGDSKIENYLKNVLHQKTLSMQHSLGYHGEQQHRTLPSKVAFAILQLRWAALTFLMGLKQNPPGTILSTEAGFNRTETVRSFFGMISWTLSLMNHILDELFTLLSEVEEEGPVTYDSIESKIQARNTPALALIFVSQSRLLFKYNLLRFRSINAEAVQSRPQNPTWRELGDIFRRSPVPIQSFEKVIVDVETSVRNIYDSNQISDAERKDIEKKMLITGSVPPKLWPAIESLLTKTLKSVREDINRATLYFHDISWIGLSDDRASDQWRKEHRLDIVLFGDGGFGAAKGDYGLAGQYVAELRVWELVDGFGPREKGD